MSVNAAFQWQQPAGATAEAANYAGWTKAELADELEKRGLTKSGSKDELIERLQEDDK